MRPSRWLVVAGVLLVCALLASCGSAPQAAPIAEQEPPPKAQTAPRRSVPDLPLLGSGGTKSDFDAAMRATPLSGTVTSIDGQRTIIRIDDNPEAVDIAAQIELRPFHIALYGTDGYKAEAVCERYDAATSSVSGRIVFVKNGRTPAVGDRASTR